MPVALQLENFQTTSSQNFLDAGSTDAEAVEDVRLAAYEKGYAAGWDDAVSAQSDDQTRIHDDLAQNLRDLSFTYQEARGHVLHSLAPLLRGMVDRVLPELMRATLGASVVAEITGKVDDMAAAPITVMVAPANKASVEAAVNTVEALPVTLVEEPTLSDGQVHFRFGDEERALDLDTLVTSIQNLVTQFLDTSDQERLAANG